MELQGKMERKDSTVSARSSRTQSEINARAQSIVSRRSGFWHTLSNLDIFKYLPVPITNEVSSRGSQSASLILIFIIFGLFVYQVVILLKDNQPRVNSHTEPLNGSTIYQAPDFAFAFVTGEKLDTVFNDDTYFQYTVEQFSQKKDSSGNYKSSLEKQPLYDCQPDWIDLEVELFCPNSTLHVQNYMTIAEDVLFPQVRLLECDETAQIAKGQTCKTKSQVDSLLSTGRLFIFLRRPSQQNVITGTYSKDSYIIYQFFITRNLENLAETLLGRQQLIQKADYVTRFREKTSEETFISNNNQYLSSINYVYKIPKRNLFSPQQGGDFIETSSNQQSLNNLSLSNQKNLLSQRILQTTPHIQKPYFQWWITNDNRVAVVELTYKTVVDLLSFMGGIAGVIYSVFVFLFMKRNAERFYKQKKLWSNFEKLIKTQDVFEPVFVSPKIYPVSPNQQQQYAQGSLSGVIELQNSVIKYKQPENESGTSQNNSSRGSNTNSDLINQINNTNNNSFKVNNLISINNDGSFAEDQL